MDNTTAHPAQDYDLGVGKTIPHIDLIRGEILSFVAAVRPGVKTWLDTGAGTGTLVHEALGVFPQAVFTLGDPSSAMVSLAQAKLHRAPDRVRFVPLGTQDLGFPDQSFDVITAVQSHHYFQPPQRRQATLNCLRMLKTDGLFLTCENTRPSSPSLVNGFLGYWKQFQTNAGKSEAEAEAHLARFGKEYFPLTLEEHLELYRSVGFTQVDVFWKSYLQTAFVCQI